MSTLWLTDEQADIDGYRRAKLGSRSDCCSLVRAITSTAAGPSAGIGLTRTAGGASIAWITDPLDGTDLGATGTWQFHVWASESAAAANAALRCQILKYDYAEAGSATIDNNAGTELGTTTKDQNLSSAAVALALADGDRLVIKLLVDDAGTLGASQTVTVAYNGQRPRAEGDTYVVCPDALALTAALPQTTRTTIRQILKDTDASNPNLSDAEIDQAFGTALRQYSDDRPYEAIDFLSGDNSAFAFTLPSRWVWGWSRLVEAEYPYDTTQQQRSVLEAADVEVVQSALGVQPLRQLWFREHIPELGTSNVLLRYTTRHEHTDEMDTVPSDDLEVVCWLAASYAALTMASKMAAASNPSILADSTDHRNASDLWRAVAKEMRKAYDDRMNGDESNGAAGTVIDLDTNLSGGGDRLFHRRRLR